MVSPLLIYSAEAIAAQRFDLKATTQLIEAGGYPVLAMPLTTLLTTIATPPQPATTAVTNPADNAIAGLPDTAATMPPSPIVSRLETETQPPVPGTVPAAPATPNPTPLLTGYCPTAIPAVGDPNTATATPPGDLVIVWLDASLTQTQVETLGQWARTNCLPLIYLQAPDCPPAQAEWAIATAPHAYLTAPVKPADVHRAIALAHQHHQTQTQLLAGQQWLQTIMASIGEGLIVCDRQGHLLYMNPRAEALTGLQQQQYLGCPVVNFLRFSHRQVPHCIIDDPLGQAMAQCQPQRLPNPCVLQVEGQDCGFVSGAATPILTATDWVGGGVLLFNDVTATVQAQQAIEQRQYHLRLQQVVMAQLSKCQDIYNGDLAAALHRITSTAAHTLNVRRVGVWLFNAAGTQLNQLQEYDLDNRQYTAGATCDQLDHTQYFAAIAASHKIAVSDVRADLRTAELQVEPPPSGQAWSRLDVPIHFRGKAVGVLSCSHLGKPRRWLLEDQNFAGYLAHLVALTLESQERSQIEHDLGELVATLQSTLESTADGILVVARDGRTLAHNQKFIDLWQIPPELLAPDVNAVDRFHFLAQQTTQPAQFMQRMLELSDLKPDETAYDRIELTDGTILDRYSQPLVRHGEIMGRSWSHRNITATVRSQQALQQNEEQLRQIFENIEDVFYLKDMASGQLIYVNPAYERLYQRSVAEMAADPNSWLEVIHPDDREQVLQASSQELYQGQFRDLEYRIVLPDQSVRWIGDHAFPIRDVNGQVYRFAGVNQDITERKRAEQLLRHQVAQEQWLNEVGERIRGTLSLETMLAIAAAAVRDWLNCDRVIIYQFLADASGIVVAEAIHPQCQSLLGERIVDPCMRREGCWDAYRQGKISVMDDLERHEITPCHADLLRSLQIRASLLLPICQGDTLWGLVGVHQCEQPRHWGEAEINLLKRFVEQLAIAIQRTNLYNATQRQARREQALNRVIQAMRQSLELPEIFQATIVEIQALLQTSDARVVRCDPNQLRWDHHQCDDTFICASALHALMTAQPPPGADCDRVEACPLFKLLAHPDYAAMLLERLQHFQPIRNDIPQDDDPLTQFLSTTLPDHFFLLLPIRALSAPTNPLTPATTPAAALWGSLLLLRDRREDEWQAWEVDVATAITEQLAIAIQQSELYHQVQSLNTHLEAEVTDRTAQLQRAFEFELLLKRITEQVRDSLDETQILQAAVRELAIALDVDSCDAGIYDLSAQTSTIAYEFVKPHVPKCEGIIFDLSHYPAQFQQMLGGQYLHFCWLNATANVIRPVPRRSTTLACPILDDQGLLGDLWLYRSVEHDFDIAEIRLVEQVANQCAIALRQARLHQATQQQVDELARLNQLKDDFLSTVSHELRTPMASIQMATQMLEVLFNQAELTTALPATTTDRLDRYLDILRTECLRETHLINDLLDLSRLDAGTEPLQYVTISPHLWLNHVAESFREQFPQAQQELILAIPANLPELTTDVNYLDRVLRELLDNAHKYTPSGAQITISATHPKANWLHIHVHNTGVAIAPVEQARIFDKFYRIPNSDPWKYAGTGLGLALAQKIALYLGGDITVMSEGSESLAEPPVDAWVCFTLHLPLQPATRQLPH